LQHYKKAKAARFAAVFANVADLLRVSAGVELAG
jgi:hypothetical protein